MGINWLLLYLPFNKTAQAKPKCTKCGAPLAPNAKFCTECGEKFVPKPIVDTMVCPNCGKTIKPTNFCPECGAKTSPKIEEEDKPPRDPTFEEMFGNGVTRDDDRVDDVRPFVIIMVVVVAIGILVALGMYFAN